MVDNKYIEAIVPVGYDEILQQSVAVLERTQITGSKLRPIYVIGFIKNKE